MIWLPKRTLAAMLAIASLIACATPPVAGSRKAPDQAGFDRLVADAMAGSRAKGLAVAYIEGGEVVFARAYGVRNSNGDPLTPDTVMYGASLTKAAFAFMVMQLAQEGVIDLDRSIADVLPKPLPEYTAPEIEDAYAGWGALAGDERWRRITPRILLTHSAGFANFGFLEPDGRLKFHFDPGARYAYSGDGYILLQFVLEQGLGLDVGQEMQKRVFDRFGMARTSMIWRPDFAANLADGWTADGAIEPHDERSRVRAAGSMDTTLADFARFAAGYVSGEGLTRADRAALTQGSLPIGSRSQFPTLMAPPPIAPFPGLGAALGVVAFSGPQGAGFFKGGHNDSTGNMWICVERGLRCVVILSNDVRAEAAFPALVEALMGDVGAPFRWEYGEMAFWRPSLNTP